MFERSWLDPLPMVNFAGRGPHYQSTIWVCVCCLFSHANGECCADDVHGGDSCEPLSLLAGQEYAIGGEHASECPNGPDGPQDTDCDCEQDTFSTSRCEGCGSYLHGERHAFTVWEPVRTEVTP